MIEVICGRKGSGKTKRIIDMANDAAANGRGTTVFIDDDNRYMYDLAREARFINATDYDICNPQSFVGFLYGLYAQDFDLETVFIDGFLKILKAQPAELGEFFARLEKYSEKNSVRVVISVSGDTAELPEFITKHAI